MLEYTEALGTLSNEKVIPSRRYFETSNESARNNSSNERAVKFIGPKTMMG